MEIVLSVLTTLAVLVLVWGLITGHIIHQRDLQGG